ncbi:unnamed protein product [Schistocephalus solidus]|uniref:ETS domain-containing protein n=1 Tax=Schistocephalus solidus TaxID=70667 RepID=A0A183TAX2_SCHSO|nr:unnamed protein product [Schistocephalus solidus]
MRRRFDEKEGCYCYVRRDHVAEKSLSGSVVCRDVNVDAAKDNRFGRLQHSHQDGVTVAPEEVVAGTHFLRLALSRVSGLAENNDTHLVVHQLEFDSSKGKVTLWQFLLQLLLDHRYAELIRWTNNAGEFVLLRAEEVARLWGLRKDNNHRMNYDKLSRALRYYYQKNIIRKVHGHKFVYRFIGLNNLKGLTFPTAHLAAEQSKENSIMQLGGRFPLPETSKSPSSKKSPKTNRNSTTSAEFPGNGPSKGYAGFAKGLVPGLGAASANLYFSTTPPMVENTAVGSNFLGTSLRFPDAVSRHSSAMFPLVPVPSAPSVSAAGAAATANSSSIESLHKISRTLGLPMPEHPPFPFYWGFPSADCKKVVDSTVSSSLLSAKTTTSTGNPMTGSQYDFERFLTGFSGVSDSNQVAAATNQVIQGMEMAHERANPKKETMGTMNQEDRLNVIASLACREVLQNILQRNASFHQDHGQGKPLLHFQNPSPTRNTAQASNLSVTASDSFHGRSPTPNCKCSCHLAPTSDLCKAETDELATGPLHSTPNAPLLAGPEKAKGWNEIVADLTKEWANQWRPTTSTQDPGNQSDPDHLSDLHYQRHLINMNRLREQINLLASEERKQAASRLSAVTVNSRAPAERSNNLPTADWNFSAYAPFLNNSMEFQPGNSPNVPSLPRATASGPGKQCADEGYVWMPVQVGLIGKWIAMLSGQMRNEVRREGTVSANHSSDLPQPPSTVGHANPHRSREFNCSLSGF